MCCFCLLKHSNIHSLKCTNVNISEEGRRGKGRRGGKEGREGGEGRRGKEGREGWGKGECYRIYIPSGMVSTISLDGRELLWGVCVGPPVNGGIQTF